MIREPAEKQAAHARREIEAIRNGQSVQNPGDDAAAHGEYPALSEFDTTTKAGWVASMLHVHGGDEAEWSAKWDSFQGT